MNNIDNHLPLLFAAQNQGLESITSHLFPRYAVSKTTLSGTLYHTIHDILDSIHSVAQRVYNTAISSLKTLYRSIQYPFKGAILNSIYPINPINGKRHLILLSRKLEKWISESFTFPLTIIGYSATREKLPYSKQPMADIVNDILSRLIKSNENLLNPPDQTPFEYEIQTVAKTSCNAFAMPAGKIVVFSQILKEIAESIQSKDITETQISFEDGTIARVNLEGIEVKDVIACLIGHEISHVASRHTLSLIIEAFTKAIFDQNAISYILHCFVSRGHEFEADITGAYLASQAGFDPRGALYLEELLRSSQSPHLEKFLDRFEIFLTHPSHKKRIRALLAAISVFSPKSLEKATSWTLSKNQIYDMNHASLAVLSAEKVKKNIHSSTST